MGFVTDATSWRWGYLVAVAAILIMIVLMRRFTSAVDPPRRETIVAEVCATPIRVPRLDSKYLASLASHIAWGAISGASAGDSSPV